MFLFWTGQQNNQLREYDASFPLSKVEKGIIHHERCKANHKVKVHTLLIKEHSYDFFFFFLINQKLTFLETFHFTIVPLLEGCKKASRGGSAEVYFSKASI